MSVVFSSSDSLTHRTRRQLVFCILSDSQLVSVYNLIIFMLYSHFTLAASFVGFRRTFQINALSPSLSFAISLFITTCIGIHRSHQLSYSGYIRQQWITAWEWSVTWVGTASNERHDQFLSAHTHAHIYLCAADSESPAGPAISWKWIIPGHIAQRLAMRHSSHERTPNSSHVFVFVTNVT